jgi:tyrosine-protein kinase Etk/Wzc
MKNNANGQNRNMKNAFVEPENEIKKYLRVLKKRKFMILSTFLVTFAAWIAYVIMFDSQPLYTASVVLHFQDARKVGAIDGEGGRKINESRVTTLTTTTLMEEIVNELQLNLAINTDNVLREDVFGYVNVSPTARVGVYTIVKDKKNPNQFQLLYTNEASGIENKPIKSFAIDDSVELAEYGFGFQLNKEFWSTQDEPVEFKIRDTDRAISTLRNMISYEWLDRRNMTFLKINITHPSPVMAAKIANTLANKFVDFDLQIKNRKSTEAEKNLGSQLVLAKRDLEIANQRLQKFKEQNPEIVGGGVSGSLTMLEQNRNTLVYKKNELQTLIEQFNREVNIDEKLIRGRELIQFLLAEGLPSATAFSAELNELVQKRNEMNSRQYGPNAQEKREFEEKFNGLFTKVIELANSHIQKLGNDIQFAERSIAREQNKLRSLPAKERELSALERDQQVKQRLYEEILMRYNQAKLSNEVEVGDVFIMDEARVPPLQSKWKIVIQKSLIGIALGLALGLLLAIVFEFFDKTVQTVEDLESKLSLPVLGSIPVIPDDNKGKSDNIKELKGKRDSKLITMDYSPTLESESYRDIRTKLLFLNQEQKLGSFVMTSLQPSEGKSLTCANLAITFAQQKISTLLIDADLRRGVLHNVFANNKQPGLGDFLVSKATIDYNNLKKLIQKTIVPNLHFIATGTPVPNPTELLGSERMKNTLNMLKQHFGMVILDTAPLLASSDAPILTHNVDGLVIVVRADYTNIEVLEQKLREYSQIQDKILGLILNMVKADNQKERYQYSYYNY